MGQNLRRLTDGSILAAALLCAQASWVQEACAQDARALFQEGEALYSSGDFDGALDAFERAYELDPRPRLLFNVALSLERLGRVTDAVETFEQYIREAEADDSQLDNARVRLGNLQERVSRTGVRLAGGPEGASIFIDGEDHGRLPRPDPIRLTRGSHEIVVRDGGQDVYRAVVALSAGEELEVEVDSSTSASVPWPAFALTIGGGVLAITGGVLGAVALAESQEAVRDSPEANRSSDLALAADILAPVGLAALAAGVVLWVLSATGSTGADDNSTAEDPAISLGPLLTPTTVGASGEGWF